LDKFRRRQGEQYERLLEALTFIGTSQGQVCVQQWMSVLSGGNMPGDVNMLIELSMGAHARPMADVKEMIRISREKVAKALSDLSECEFLVPAATPVVPVLNQLEQVRAARLEVERRRIRPK
jgi:hypothetical protein